MNKTNNYSNINFTGCTKIYALADSHQETRKTSAFLTKILNDNKNDKNVLLVHSGDIFKGIYPRELERDCYIKLKDVKSDIEIVMTLGNNDFGFNKEGLDYLIDTVKTFKSKGIKTVSANIFKSDGSRPQWIKPYEVIERDGDRTFITGFCIDNINTKKFGIIPKKSSEVLGEIQQAIVKEQPDNVVILNHDYLPESREIVKTCKENGINIDVVIGGHDHEFVQPDMDLNIYYPQAFCETMYKFDLINNKKNKVKNIDIINSKELKPNKLFAKEIEEYEEKSGLLDSIAPSVLNLTKKYSEPSPLGSFLADEMKNISNSDIAFFSTGFLMKPLKYEANSDITNYLFKKTIIAETPINTVELSAKDLKDVFQHSLKTHGYGSSNPKFLQCSNNIKIEGTNNTEQGIWELKQIYINNEPLLNEKSEPFNTTKKYKCAIDSYIADGGQGFDVIKSQDKQDVLINDTPVKINEVLMNGLKQAPKLYKKGASYPFFDLSTI